MQELSCRVSQATKCSGGCPFAVDGKKTSKGRFSFYLSEEE